MTERQRVTQADVEAMNDAERLGLLVAGAYGTALAERDEARSLLADALLLTQDFLDAWPETTWAADNHRKVLLEERRARLVQAIQAAQDVDSQESPAQEEPTP